MVLRIVLKKLLFLPLIRLVIVFELCVKYFIKEFLWMKLLSPFSEIKTRLNVLTKILKFSTSSFPHLFIMNKYDEN